MATRINGCGGRRWFLMQISSNEYDHTVFVLSTRIADGVGPEPFLLFAFVRRLGGEER